MQIRILKDAAISLLKKNIESNKVKYENNEEWLDEFFKEKNILYKLLCAGIIITGIAIPLILG